MRCLLFATTTMLVLVACGHSDPLESYIRSIPDCDTVSEVAMETRVVFDPQNYPQHILDPTKSSSGNHWVQNWPEVWTHVERALQQSHMTQPQINDAINKRNDDLGCG